MMMRSKHLLSLSAFRQTYVYTLHHRMQMACPEGICDCSEEHGELIISPIGIISCLVDSICVLLSLFCFKCKQTCVCMFHCSYKTSYICRMALARAIRRGFTGGRYPPKVVGSRWWWGMGGAWWGQDDYGGCWGVGGLGAKGDGVN